MPGIEGRLIIALGSAYLVSLIASMVVSLTVTPYYLPYCLTMYLAGHEKETKIVLKIKERITPYIYWCINNVKIIGGAIIIVLLLTIGMYFLLAKKEFPLLMKGLWWL